MEYLHERFTEEELLLVQAELIEIRNGYVPSMPWDAPTANQFYITSTWNQRHQDNLLDGPEVDYILAYTVSVEEAPTEEKTPIEEV